MKMSKITENENLNNEQNNNDKDADRVLAMMAKMQKQAEMSQSDENYNTAVNSPKTLYNDSKFDNANYWEIKGLPSRGVLYPDNVLIEARPLKVIEVKKLASITPDNADYVINDIIKRCVRVTGLEDVSELFLSDKLYIIFWIRAVTYRDSSYTVEFQCPKCEKKSKYHFEVKNLEVNYLKDDYDPDMKLNMENGQYIKLRYLKIRDENEIERFVNVNQKLLGEIDEELLALACMITNINGNEKATLLERYNYVLEFTPRDLSYVTTYVGDYAIGIDETMNVECQDCGGVVPLGVSFRSEFFLPKYTIK